MPVASGLVTADSNGNFTSDFTLESSVHKQFNGSFSSATPAFTASLSKAEFKDANDMSGGYSLDQNATIGPTTLNIPLVNDSGKKIVISGTLNPHLDKAYNVKGLGKWHSS
ncbi:hypothetical protein FHL15_006907 [Xylaria flabelliformis]|uniref:Uncharacterized protein n=1 Tax=Xylaria flabelliformis TaxID=2512241 RepID=A0A553HWG1_9PEZI|nr:hypothetical protein FHL15_006907 [Xylaria flabelliformis]